MQCTCSTLTKWTFGCMGQRHVIIDVEFRSNLSGSEHGGYVFVSNGSTALTTATQCFTSLPRYAMHAGAETYLVQLVKWVTGSHVTCLCLMHKMGHIGHVSHVVLRLIAQCVKSVVDHGSNDMGNSITP